MRKLVFSNTRYNTLHPPPKRHFNRPLFRIERQTISQLLVTTSLYPLCLSNEKSHAVVYEVMASAKPFISYFSYCLPKMLLYLTLLVLILLPENGNAFHLALKRRPQTDISYWKHANDFRGVHYTEMSQKNVRRSVFRKYVLYIYARKLEELYVQYLSLLERDELNEAENVKDQISKVEKVFKRTFCDYAFWEEFVPKSMLEDVLEVKDPIVYLNVKDSEYRSTLSHFWDVAELTFDDHGAFDKENSKFKDPARGKAWYHKAGRKATKRFRVPKDLSI